MADSRKVKVGPGTLYVAQLGSIEPTSISGAWPSAWHQLGYTDAGSVFAYSTTFSDITVEEELWPTDSEASSAAGSMTFALAEQTANNLLIALNAGTLDDRVAAATGTITDGVWVEPVSLGAEKKVMIGWDSLDYNQNGSAFSRIVARQCVQSGDLQITHRKAPNKSTYACVFSFQKPTGLQPFRTFFPNSLAS